MIPEKQDSDSDKNAPGSRFYFQELQTFASPAKTKIKEKEK